MYNNNIIVHIFYMYKIQVIYLWGKKHLPYFLTTLTILPQLVLLDVTFTLQSDALYKIDLL